MQTQTGTAASLLELLSTFPSLRTRGLLRQILGVSERTLKAQVAKDPGATLTLEQGRPVSYRLRECHAKPNFPGNPGSLGPNYDTMLFFPWMEACGQSSAGCSKPPSIAPMIRARQQSSAPQIAPNYPQSTLWPLTSDGNQPEARAGMAPVLVWE